MKKCCERNLITILGFLKSQGKYRGTKSHGRRKGGGFRCGQSSYSKGLSYVV